MLIAALFSDLSAHIASPEFLLAARHPQHPTAFTRNRKLPLPGVVAVLLSGMRKSIVLLSGMRKSIQAELDQFFAHLRLQAQLVRHVTQQAFSEARAKLSATALPALNDWLIARAQHYGFVRRWQGLRLVAADASTVRFGVRASQVAQAAQADQVLFSLFLPSSELTLCASLYSMRTNNERQMLFEHLDRLSSTDLLLMDRGYPCAWLVSVLNQRKILFCMRVEKSGSGEFACVRDFRLGSEAEQIVTLRAPSKRDCDDYGCPKEEQTVRLVRHVTPDGQTRVLMTNCLDMQRFPRACFSDLYHQRWGIEEAFKRLKHKLNLEHVSGLSQQAVEQDVAAKVLCDNLQVLSAMAAHEGADLDESLRINHAYAHSVLKPLLPALLLAKKVGRRLLNALKLIASETYRHRPGTSKPREPGPKPHKYMTQKNC